MMAGVDATMPQRQKLRQKKPAGSFTLGCIDEAEEEEAEFTHIAATGEKKKRYHAEDGDLFPQLGGPGPLRNRNIQQVNESWQNDSCKLDALASSSRAESFPRLSKNTSNEVLQGGRKVAFEQIESAPEENETGNVSRHESLSTIRRSAASSKQELSTVVEEAPEDAKNSVAKEGKGHHPSFFRKVAKFFNKNRV